MKPIRRNSKVAVLIISTIFSVSNSNGLLLANTSIATTALENDLTLLTFNVADFQFIKDLKWQLPPN